MIASLIYIIVGFAEFLVGFRFLFRLLGANPNNGFVQWIYDWSTPLVAPFAGIFGQESTVTGEGVVTQSVFDWTALIAFAIYAIIAFLLIRAAAGFVTRRV